MAAAAVCSLLLGGFSAAGLREAPGLDLGIPIRSAEGRRLRAASLQDTVGSFGATLDAVHAHRIEEDSLVQVRHVVEPPLEEPAGRPPWSSERELVQMLMHMNSAAYADKPPYEQAVLEPVVQQGDSLYGPGVDTYEKEVAQEKAHMDAWISRFEDTSSRVDGGTGINASGLDGIGVYAMEFTVRGVGKVLVFRGSTSKGDYDNIKMWVTQWILSKMSAKMNHDWSVIAKLPWSEEFKDHRTPVPGFLLKTLLRAGSRKYVSKFTKRLARLANSSHGGVDPEKVAMTGYWEFTKLIANSVRSNLKPNEELILTGHSQGGTRAQLVSMYLEETFGEKHRTVTFGAVGGQCFSRKMFFSGAALTDVNPYVSHSQIVNYVHPLDLYGMIDYGFGTQCVYGATSIAESKAKKYCEKVFGYKGYELTLAGAILGIGSDLGNAYNRCRYFTHMWMAMDRDLMNETYLHEDGTTDGGCAPLEVIPKSDPDKKCKSVGLFDGCSHEISCGGCQATSSATGLFSCYWCESSKKCVSGSKRGKCTDGYIGPQDACPAVFTSSVEGSP